MSWKSFRSQGKGFKNLIHLFADWWVLTVSPFPRLVQKKQGRICNIPHLVPTLMFVWPSKGILTLSCRLGPCDSFGKWDHYRDISDLPMPSPVCLSNSGNPSSDFFCSQVMVQGVCMHMSAHVHVCVNVYVCVCVQREAGRGLPVPQPQNIQPLHTQS